eukprot:30166-Pelagococcus_subviridis.AAC.4
MKKDTTNVSQSVSRIGGRRPEMRTLNGFASLLQYHSRKPSIPTGGSTTHADASPTVKMLDGKMISKNTNGMMTNTRLDVIGAGRGAAPEVAARAGVKKALRRLRGSLLRREHAEARRSGLAGQRSLARDHDLAFAFFQIVDGGVHDGQHAPISLRVPRLVFARLFPSKLHHGVIQLVAFVQQTVRRAVVEDRDDPAEVIREERLEHVLHGVRGKVLDDSPVVLHVPRRHQVRHQHDVVRRPHGHDPVRLRVVRVHRSSPVDVRARHLDEPRRARGALLLRFGLFDSAVAETETAAALPAATLPRRRAAPLHRVHRVRGLHRVVVVVVVAGSSLITVERVVVVLVPVVVVLVDVVQRPVESDVGVEFKGVRWRSAFTTRTGAYGKRSGERRENYAPRLELRELVLVRVDVQPGPPLVLDRDVGGVRVVVRVVELEDHSVRVVVAAAGGGAAVRVAARGRAVETGEAAAVRRVRRGRRRVESVERVAGAPAAALLALVTRVPPPRFDDVV